MSMMWPLRYHKILRVRLKKSGGKDRRAPNTSGMKYGIRVPRNAKKATQFDQENGNLLWTKEILKELEALMSMKVFEKLLSSLRKSRAKSFQFAPLRIIFDVKVDRRRNARLVIGGHVVDSSGHKVYEITMKSVSARILMTIAAVNNLDVMTVDIGNAYVPQHQHRRKIYTCAGAEFEVVGIMAEGNFMEFIKALYGLPISGNRRNAHLFHTLREMGFKPTRFDQNVWIRGREGGYDYIGTYTDYVLVVATEPTSISEKLKETYTIKAFSPPKFHLGCDYA